MIQNNRVQNYVAHKITSALSGYFSTKVTLGHISLNLFHQLIITDFYVEDKRFDSLLFSRKVTIAVDEFNPIKKIIKIEKIELVNADIHFFIDSSRNINLKFIIDKLIEKSDSTKKGWNVSFNNIGIIHSKFVLKDCEGTKCDTGINLSFIRLKELNVRVKNLTVINGIASFKINRLSFKEYSGFELGNISAKMTVQKTKMHFDDVQILTDRSNIHATRVYFDFAKIGDFSDFAQKIKVSFQFEKSNSSFADIAYFAHPLWGMNENFSISGIAKGKISDLKCKQLKFKIGQASTFNGNINLSGLPKISETFLFIDAKELFIYPKDVENWYIPKIDGNKIILPELVKKFSYVHFKGNFTGFVNDFVTYGTFTTQLGTIKADLSLKPQPNKQIIFKGMISAERFNAGELLSLENKVGLLDMNLTAEGKIFDKTKITGSFNSVIHNLDMNGYNYSDIEVSGILNENVFNGLLSLDDPNAKLAVNGQFNFTKTVPEFNFSGNIKKLELHKLNIIKKDSIFNISTHLLAKFKGNNLNNFEGEITLDSARIKKNNKELQVVNFNLTSFNSSEMKGLELKSDIVDAYVKGKQDYGKIVSDLLAAFRIYVPSSFYKTKNNNISENNEFSFTVNLKKPKGLFEAFLPGISIAANTKINGKFHPTDSIITFLLSTNFMQIGNNRFDKLTIEGQSNHDSLKILINSDLYSNGEQIKFINFSVASKASNDSIYTQFDWVNSNAIKTKNIHALSYYSQNSAGKAPVLNINLFPSEFYFLDSLWEVNECHIKIDTSSINIPLLTLIQNDKVFKIKGTISENLSDSLKMYFSNISLETLNLFLKNNKILFDGKVNGTVGLTDFYNNRLFGANLAIENLTVNKESIGQTKVDIKWSNSEQKVLVTAEAYQSNIHSVQMEGSYTPDDKSLDFTIKIEKISAGMFQPIIASIFTIEDGRFTGKINLTGNLSKPLLNGDVDITNADLKVNYLNTDYKFDSRVKIYNNRFLINDLKMFDKFNNTCTVNGYIFNNYFKDFDLNINVDFDKLMVLNTDVNDNWPIYGNAFATGNVVISGSPNNIKIDVERARTEKNTIIYIPLDKKNDITENTFLTFINKNSKKTIDSSRIENKNQVTPTGVSFNMNLEVTPEAEVQLVFDPRIGDIMRSQGSGNIKIDINTEGNFKIIGDYTVSSGDYLFAMQNLINKKFILEPGGIISWTGNPLDATLDARATYRTKAAISQLVAGDNTSNNVLNINPEYKTRIPIDCQLFITGKLLNPNIKYDIFLPNSTEDTRTTVKSYIRSEEDLSKQFLSLLILNSFMPNSGNDPNIQNAFGKDFATTTSLELLSSRLSGLISQVSKDVDVGVNYRPGDNVYTSQEVEVALSTQLLNDRVSINGNLDVYGNQSSSTTSSTPSGQTPAPKPNNLLGDVTVEVKITDDGKLRFKAFNRVNDQMVNDQMLYTQEPYTQGVGLLYREEFKNFGELRKKYFRNPFKKKKPIIQPEPKKNDKSQEIELHEDKK